MFVGNDFFIWSQVAKKFQEKGKSLEPINLNLFFPNRFHYSHNARV